MKLINGDCIEELKKIEDGSVDMILTDLPYGTTNCKWDTIIPFEDLWNEYNRIIKPNGVVALFGAEPFSSYLRLSNIKNYRYDWKWDKVQGGNHLNAKKIPLQRYEDIIIFYKSAGKYSPIMEERGENRASRYGKKSAEGGENKTNVYGIKEYKSNFEHFKSNKKYPTNKLEYHCKGKELNSLNRVHPTQKPVDLLEYLIKTYTNEGEVVLDSTMGSGSTGVACINTGRDFIGIELDTNYYNIAVKRVREAEEGLKYENRN